MPRSTPYLPCVLAMLLTLPGCAAWQATKLLVAGDNIELLPETDQTAATESRPDILLLAMDGVDRDLLYDMLRAQELPELAALLGVRRGKFTHAHFEDSLLSTLPSSTGVAWATMMTGVEPAEHGVTGNEFFIRATGEFGAPVPVTVGKVEPILRIYTEGYANQLLRAPTVYEQMREREPDIRIAVAMHQYYAGADELILTDRSALAEAFRTFLSDEAAALLNQDQTLGVFSDIDSEIVENVRAVIAKDSTPDIITVYLPGIDHFAHVSDMGPDPARRLYLKKAIEPLMRSLREDLIKNGELENRYVVISSDHGHTEVPHDDAHSMATTGDDDPPALLKSAGYTVRPFDLEVAENTYFNTVLAYQGALAFVYVVDQSSCPVPDVPCDWTKPARRADIHSVADAFFENNRDGNRVPQMRNTLDMILVRTAASKGAKGDVFEVYLGAGRSQPVKDYMAAHPHPDYVEFPKRLRDLTVGPHGDRAGDVILIANNGNTKTPDERYYFASLYYSWHGSPSKKDSQVPFIVAHPNKTTAQLKRSTQAALKSGNSLAAVTRLLLNLRYPNKSP